MKNLIIETNFIKKIDLLDRYIFIFISLIPLSLAISIFFADLLASLTGIIFIMVMFLNKNKNRKIILNIKKEVILFFVFYLIILISFFLNDYKSYSYLSSIFYFRYILLALAIFYLLYKYDFLLKKLSIIIIFSFLFILIDSYMQLTFGFNLFGYKSLDIGNDSSYITGFFNDEKKLGSYLVRNLPLIISLIILNFSKRSNLIQIIIILLTSILIFYSSERVALALLFFFLFVYFFISKKKLIFILSSVLIIYSLFLFNYDFRYKYLNYTSLQSGIIFLDKSEKFDEQKKNSKEWFNNDKLRYYSLEHENLSFTGLKIFEKNMLFGTSVKSFHHACKDVKKEYGDFLNKRNNKLVCSTHPHNIYIQLLAETGIIGFTIILSILLYCLFQFVKNILAKENSKEKKSLIMVNCVLIINLMPLLPSGSFFNNWMSLILFFSIGFYLFMNKKFQ